MRAILRMVGSVHFAVFLILCTALLVIVGTFIESKTESHKYAAQLTYGSPVFLLLLACFYLNILFSALNRWPFKKKHIGFLTTHLGLLMILTGVIYKNFAGKQGHMTLVEGSASRHILLPDQQMLYVEGRDHAIHYLPFQKKLWGSLPRQFSTSDGLKLELLQYIPHCEERFETWIKGNQLVLSGFPPLPVYDSKSDSEQIRISGRLRLDPNTDDLWDIYAYRTSNPQEIIEKISPSHLALLFLVDEQEEVKIVTFSQQGPSTKQTFPNPPDSILVYDQGFQGYGVQATIVYEMEDQTLEKRIKDFENHLRSCEAEEQALPPPLRALQDACIQSDLDFPSTAAQFLSQRMPTLLSRTKTREFTLETTLTAVRKSKVPTKSLEKNVPRVILKATKGNLVEVFVLAFDPTGSNLKWPILEGNYLIRFQPKLEEIPYKVRLRQARQFNYPGSTRAYSYESDLLIQDLNNFTTEEKTISMNNVYETMGGYRFYLSKISPTDEGSVKKIQLVVNHDPVKYVLTYPGAVVISLGILLLFWGSNKKRLI